MEVKKQVEGLSLPVSFMASLFVIFCTQYCLYKITWFGVGGGCVVVGDYIFLDSLQCGRLDWENLTLLLLRLHFSSKGCWLRCVAFMQLLVRHMTSALYMCRSGYVFSLGRITVCFFRGSTGKWKGSWLALVLQLGHKQSAVDCWLLSRSAWESEAAYNRVGEGRNVQFMKETNSIKKWESWKQF